MQNIFSDISTSLQIFSCQHDEMPNPRLQTNICDNDSLVGILDMHQIIEQMSNQNDEINSQSEILSNKAQRMSSSLSQTDSIDNNIPQNMFSLHLAIDQMINQGKDVNSNQELISNQIDELPNSHYQTNYYDNFTKSVFTQHQFTEQQQILPNESNSQQQQFFLKQEQRIPYNLIQTISNDDKFPQIELNLHQTPEQMLYQQNETNSIQQQFFSNQIDEMQYECVQPDSYHENTSQDVFEILQFSKQQFYKNLDENMENSHNQTNSNNENLIPLYEYNIDQIQDQIPNLGMEINSQSEISQNQAQRMSISHISTNSNDNFSQSTHIDVYKKIQIIKQIQKQKPKRKKYVQDQLYKGIPQRLCILFKEKPKGKDFRGHLVNLISLAVVNTQSTTNNEILEIAQTYDSKSNKFFVNYLKNMLSDCQHKIDDVETNKSVDRALRNIYKQVTFKLQELAEKN